MALIDRIKFGGSPNTLVWKWRDENLHSDSIVLGSQLIVNESQEALFFKGGKALDLFGPGTHTLSTANLPILQRLVGLPFGGKTPFTAEIYFVSKAVALGQDWGTTTPIMLLDPQYRVTVPLRAYGQYAVRVANAREFVVQIVGTSGGADASTAAGDLLQAPIVSCVQQALGDCLVKRKISALELPAHTTELAADIQALVAANYLTLGVEIVNFTVESINFDKEDESVVRLRSMLDEAARLAVVGDAFRRNEDFYRADRQYGVLDSAAKSGGAGGITASAMGIGLGFGLAGPATDVARQAMAPAAQAQQRCPACGSALAANVGFCPECGTKVAGDLVPCPACKAPNPASSKFCSNCGQALGALKCAKCGAQLPSGTTFCGECGTKV